jgi:hypothetical protein
MNVLASAVLGYMAHSIVFNLTHMPTIMKTPKIMRSLPAIALLAMSSLALTSPTSTWAGTPDKAVVEVAPSEPWIHALLQIDISDHYITPRGLNVENEGVIFQPLFLVFWDLYKDKDASFLTGISLTTGVWSSIHTNESGADPGYWNEFDPIFGLTFKFKGGITLDTTYTAFDSMVDSYPTSSHLEVKLSYDDTPILGAFALHPYVAFWQELDEKATVVFNTETSESTYYFTIGINPSFKAGPVKFEFPTFINLVAEDFYQQFDGSGGGSGLAVFCTSVKASIPLTFVPKDMGFWTLYAGVKYYHLSNDGLRDGNSVLTANEHKDDLVQFHGGLSIFF